MPEPTTILLGNVYSHLVAEDEVIRAVAERLAAPVPGAKYTTWFKSGKWDGRHRFLERPSNRFFSGLLSLVQDELARLENVYGVIDRREVPERILGFPAWRGPTLRPYQNETEQAAIKRQRGILRVGAGGGKTVIAGRLLADLAVPALFLVHRKELAQQTLARFGEWLAPEAVGLVEGDRWEERPVVVAMIQTLHARLRAEPKRVTKFLEGRGLVFADECHRAGSDTWSRVLRWTGAYYRYGLSGTPLVDSDVRDLALIGLTGPVIADISAAELAERGWLARAVCTFLDYGAERGGANERLSYQTAYNQLIVHNMQRNALALQILSRHPNSQTLFITRKVKPPNDHGHILERLSEGQLPYVSGEDTDFRRKEVYTQFRARVITQLSCSTIYDEGVDFPALDVVVNLAGGKTIVPLFQRLGRAMHREDTSTPIFYYDFADLGNRYLRRHYERRRRELGRAGFEVRLE